jgi:gamma-glutamylcyclotransferase (GGCT)/AIG2-like uncharacterized protein YtfP
VNLFAYGTLVEKRAMGRITGRTLRAGLEGTIHGYRKWETTLGYPIVLPDAHESCTGVVYYNLTAADWERLDTYEQIHKSPPVYTRKLVTVQAAHGLISAQLYVGNLNYFRARLKI